MVLLATMQGTFNSLIYMIATNMKYTLSPKKATSRFESCFSFYNK